MDSDHSDPILYSCSFDECDAVFYRKDRLDCHMRVHTGDRPFTCSFPGCSKSYTRASHLKRHQISHEEGEIRCSVDGCNAVLKCAATLKKHINIVHEKKEPKVYKCSYCSKGFNKRNYLKGHEYKHTNVKPCICPVEGCEKRFLYPTKLKRHMKVHDGYTCHHKGCSKVLSTWSLYLKHLKVEHPVKHKCEYCEKSFTTFWNRKLHMSTHALDRTTFNCPIPDCARFYFDERNLKFHIKNYHEMKPYKCKHEGCHRAFREMVSLEKHEKTHDPNIPLSSKKRKQKSKRRKKSFSAFLSGYDESPERDEKEASKGECVSSTEDVKLLNISENSKALVKTNFKEINISAESCPKSKKNSQDIIITNFAGNICDSQTTTNLNNVKEKAIDNLVGICVLNSVKTAV